MARFVYETMLAEAGEIDDVFPDMQMDQERFSTGGVSYYHDDSVFGGNARITLTGEGMEYQNAFELTAGQVHKVTFGDDWTTALKVTGLDLDVVALDQALVEHGAMSLLYRLTAGNDKVIGSTAGDQLFGGAGTDVIKAGKGRDLIDGGLGSDTISGGSGSDDFFFASGQGKDTITDFDAKGGGHKQDYVQLTDDDPFTIHARGHDTVLDFGNGSTLTLLDVDRQDFSRSGDIHYVEF